MNNPADSRSGGGRGREKQPPSAAPAPRLQFNPGPLKVVDDKQREVWERLTDEVEIIVAEKFRKRWTLLETVRVVVAEPSETYEAVAAELNRSPGAVRYRRMAMVHILRDEHGAMERVRAYEADPKAHHKFHDYYQVYGAIEALGLLALPITEQFNLAQPLRQPSKSWRGDGTSAVVGPGRYSELRDEVKRMIREVHGGDA